MSAANILREARNTLFEDGWHQGSLWGPNGSSCSMGAIYYAALVKLAESSIDYQIALAYFSTAIDTAAIGEWNDKPERTFDDVVDAFDRAEKIAEHGASSIPLSRFGIVA